MITFENGALTIDTTLSVADSQAISAFADTVRNGEQERIIKLLEAHATAWSEDCTLPIDWKHCQNCWQFASLIALIKGEK